MRKSGLDPNAVLRDVGRRIAEIRRARGMTQEKFAEAADLSWKYVQHVEAGRENLTLKSLVNFANLLGAKVSDFMTAPREKKPKPGRPPRVTAKKVERVVGRAKKI